MVARRTPTDTDIRYVTRPDANLFLELGFPPDEAERLRRDAERQIDAMVAVKEQLMDELARWIEQNRLKQAEVAAVLRVSRPRVSDLVHRKTAKFSIDTLVTMLGRIGLTVKVAVG